MTYDVIKISGVPEISTPSESTDIVLGDGNYLKRIKYNTVKADMVGTSPTYTTDTEPYLMRRTEHVGVVGKCALDKLVGGSLGWNQLNVNDRTSGSSNGITATKDSSGTWTLSGTATATALINPVTSSTFDLVANHVMYLGGCPSGGTTNTYQLDVRKSGVIVTGAIDVGNGNLFKVVESGAHSINMRVASGTTVNNIKFTPQLIDLTQMFGSTIADYAYSLGLTNGIAWLSKYIDLSSYHAYDAGSVQSVQATAHVTTGKNLLDVTNETSGSNAHIREYNLPNLPLGIYTVSAICNSTASTNCAAIIIFADGANTATQLLTNHNWSSLTLNVNKPVSKLRIYSANNYATSQSNTIVVTSAQLEFGSTATAYEPYNGHTYPLGSDTLSGYPMLVNNKLAFDGDEKLPDGTIRRKYGIVDLGTLEYTGDSGGFVLSASIGAKVQPTQAVMAKIICSKYPTIMQSQLSGSDKCVYGLNWGNGIGIRDSTYSTPAAFKTAMSGVYLVYELATETTESSTAYQKVQTIDADGTESFTTSSPVPVGHETQTPDNILAALNWLGE